jgi:hypothetical protein
LLGRQVSQAPSAQTHRGDGKPLGDFTEGVVHEARTTGASGGAQGIELGLR